MKPRLSSIMTCLLLILGVTGCNTDSGHSKQRVRKKEFPDNAFADIPREFLKETEKRGTIVSINYETRFYATNSDTFEKTALVYLPYGYDQDDKKKKYNVLYLLHGGGDDEKAYFKGTDKKTQIKNLLDNMIESGMIEPCIVVTPSYQNKYSSDETLSCKYFHNELAYDLIPAVEGKFNTYAKDTTEEGLKNSRLHRAFAGFSMGSAATWWTFTERLDIIGYFMPISGDSWCVTTMGGLKRSDDTAKHLADAARKFELTAKDFYIYAGTGSNDIAYPNMTPQIEAMKKLTDVFIYCDNFKDGNLYYCVYPEGYHNIDTVMRILYNGLPKFFG